MESRPEDRERGVLDALHRAARVLRPKRSAGTGSASCSASPSSRSRRWCSIASCARSMAARSSKPLVTTDWRHIALAALFVAGGYFTLTFYDLFALRTIGRADVPYRAAALAGFTSYSVGHNVGASVLTGGAVRYRVYSAWGLNAIEVAKICFVAGLTFWLGNATVLGLGIALCAARRHGHRPVAGLAQPRRRIPDPDRARALCRLGVAAPARRRPGRVERRPCPVGR